MEFSLEELAQLTESELVGNPDHTISNIADLESAEAHDASFLANPSYEKAMKNSRAGVVFIDSPDAVIPGMNFLITKTPSRSFQIVLEKFLSERGPATSFTGIHPTAIVHESATIGKNVVISPYAVLERDVCIGDNTVVGPFVYLGCGVSTGKDCMLHAHSVIREYCLLGERVILQPGVVIGSCGFGYTNDATGRYIKLQQLGNVVIEDDVEVGANTTIDRSRFKTTRIGKGTKIDNQVQIAHGAILGENNCIVSQVGISGSAKMGKNVILAGQSGVAGHITIGDNIIIAGRGGVTKSLKAPGKYGGNPAQPLDKHNRSLVHLRNLDRYVTQIKELEKRLQILEDRS